MELESWGRTKRIFAARTMPSFIDENMAKTLPAGPLIPRGQGRSYGDASLEFKTLDTRRLDHFIAWDRENGILCCEAGVTLRQILQVFVPKGWFLAVTPGTQFISVGGAVAGDVHGKNHETAGTFTDHVLELEVLLGTGEIVTCSRHHNADLFFATCGGMGLTGVIVSVALRLRPLASSWLRERTDHVSSISDLLQKIKGSHEEYSVAWLDGTAPQSQAGRGFLFRGEHLQEGNLTDWTESDFRLPSAMPGFFLNGVSRRLFNAFYVKSRMRKNGQQAQVPLQPFFYPLDRVINWNRLYGSAGLHQYQAVLPFESAESALLALWERMSERPYLAVVKKFGREGDGLLSFPRPGVTIAMDFKASSSLAAVFDEFDAIVLNSGGRLNLSKDSRMSEQMFKNTYPRWEEFEAIRARYGATGRFSSLQSKRIGLL